MVLKERDGILFYESDEFSFADDDWEVNNNCKSLSDDGKPISCRQLAFAWQAMDSRKESKTADIDKTRAVNFSSYHLRYRSKTGIRAIKFLKHNFYDKLRIQARADRYIATDIKGNGLGKALLAVCASMAIGDKRTMTLGCENHMIGIVVKRKTDPDRFIVKFYDPNTTLTHQRAVCKNLDDLTSLSLNDFLSPETVRAYFPKMKSFFLALYNNPKNPATENPAQHIEYLDTDEPLTTELRKQRLSELLAYACYLGKFVTAYHCMATLLKLTNAPVSDTDMEYLSAKTNAGSSGVLRAMGKGNCKVVSYLIELILKSKLPSEKKFELLLSRHGDEDPTTSLVMAINQKKQDATELYIQLILNTDQLSSNQKFELLSVYHSQSLPGLIIENFPVSTAAVMVMKCADMIIKNTDLSSDQKIILLNIDNDEDILGLSESIATGNTERAQQIIAVILTSERLSSERKATLLNAVTSGLNDALDKRDNKMVAAIRQQILSSDQLDASQKLKILGADSNPAILGLTKALQADTVEQVQPIVYLVMQANKLNTPEKINNFLTQLKQCLPKIDSTTGRLFQDPIRRQVNASLEAVRECSSKSKSIICHTIALQLHTLYAIFNAVIDDILLDALVSNVEKQLLFDSTAVPSIKTSVADDSAASATVA